MDEELKKIIIDRLEGWELVDFLQISIEECIEAFEEDILQNIDDVEDYIGLKGRGDSEDA
jgi:hypothetical protein